jgi:hypothetical protein
VIVVVVIAALVALAVSSFVWAKSYAPLHVTAYGPGFGVSERPVGSGDDPTCLRPCGHLGFVVRGKGTRIAEFHVVVKNDGRWPVTIQRAELESYCMLPINSDICIELQALRRGPRGDDPSRSPTAGPFRPLRVAAHGSAEVWVRLLTNCRIHEDGYRSGAYSLPLVYRYLGHFERTQNVLMPFDVVFIC